MRFDKWEKKKIRKTELEYVHPHYTYFLSYCALKWGRKRGGADKIVTLQTEKMKVGFELLWMNSGTGI